MFIYVDRMLLRSWHPVLIELYKEARIEHCRATRDLSSYGCYVQHVLINNKNSQAQQLVEMKLIVV